LHWLFQADRQRVAFEPERASCNSQIDADSLPPTRLDLHIDELRGGDRGRVNLSPYEPVLCPQQTEDGVHQPVFERRPVKAAEPLLPRDPSRERVEVQAVRQRKLVDRVPRVRRFVFFA
jgi:hypothetical protein